MKEELRQIDITARSKEHFDHVLKMLQALPVDLANKVAHAKKITDMFDAIECIMLPTNEKSITFSPNVRKIHMSEQGIKLVYSDYNFVFEKDQYPVNLSFEFFTNK